MMAPLQELNRKRKSAVLSFLGAVSLILSCVFLENMAVSGCFAVAGLVLLLAGGLTARTRGETVMAFLCLWAGHFLRYSQVFGGHPAYILAVGLLLFPYCGALFAGILADRKLRKAGKTALAVLVVPTVYTLLAHFTALLELGFIVNLATYVMCLPHMAENLYRLGEYGLTFMILLVLSCAAGLITEEKRRKKGLCALAALLLCAALLFNGTLLAGRRKEPDFELQIALATSQEMEYTGETGKFYSGEQQLEMFRQALEQAVQEGAQLLVLNEEYFDLDEDKQEEWFRQIGELVKTYGIPVLAGVELEPRDGGIAVNEVIYLDKNGEILYTYIKNNLVPFLETGIYEDGPEEPADLEVDIGGHRINLAFIICFDINDPEYMKKIPEDTELLLVPCWDWDRANLEQKRTHIQSALPGTTVVKHSFDGFSYVSDPGGQCLEMLDLRDRYEQLVTVTVPIWKK